MKYLSNPKTLLLLAFVLLAARVLYLLLHPSVLSWDAAIYITMARYIESGGALGLWEGYRPPLLPLLYTVGVVLGIPIPFAIGVTVGASFGALYMAYKIGEHYLPTAGGWASIVLATSALFTTFSIVPTTEVFGVLGFFIALYVLFIRRQYFFAGIVTALLFILRFPYGLLLPLLGITIVIYSWYESHSLSGVVKHALWFTLGASIVIIPYLISNVYIFGNALTPILAGAQVAREVGFLYIQSPLFYVGVLCAGAPLLVFAVVYFFYNNTLEIKRVVAVLGAIAVIFFAYFTYEAHKEARYIMPVLAPLTILAGLGIALFFNHFQNTRARAVALCSIAVILVGSTIGLLFVNIGFIKDHTLTEYYKTFRSHPGITVLSSTPTLGAYAPVKIAGVYTTISEYLRVFEEQKDSVDMVYINSCDLVQCQASKSCSADIGVLLETLAPSVDVTTIINLGSCQIVIGEVKE